jgi:predicted nucleotidyltransferase
MNPHAQWRLDLARRLSLKLRRFAGIEAIVVGGSVARDYSDAYSDIELILYWEQPPTQDVRHAIISDLQAAYRYPAIDPSHDSALLIEGCPVDLWHLAVADQLATMHAVLEEYSVDLDAGSVLDTIGACVPFYGEEMVQEWKERVAVYPEALTVRFLETYLPHFHLRQIHLAAYRDDPTTFYYILSTMQRTLFLCLLALNRFYFPTFKWMYTVLDSMPLAPAQVGPRLRQMFGEPPLRAVASLHDVLAQTLALAERHYPELDTAYARYRLNYLTRSYALPR